MMQIEVLVERDEDNYLWGDTQDELIRLPDAWCRSLTADSEPLRLTLSLHEHGADDLWRALEEACSELELYCPKRSAERWMNRLLAGADEQRREG